MKQSLTPLLKKYFTNKRKIKELQEIDSDLVSRIMKRMKGRKLKSAKAGGDSVTVVSPATVIIDIDALKKLVERPAVLAKAKKAGYAEDTDDLMGTVITTTESVNMVMLDQMVQQKVITLKQFRAISTVRPNKVYLRPNLE